MSAPMPPALAARYADELARAAHDSSVAGWSALETAHVLAQPWAGAHVRTHWRMLRRGLREHDAWEVAGQIARLLVAGPGSLTGRYPVGNTGRARVKATLPMTVPDDLAALLDARPGRRG
jgi:hypothetical protein